MEWRVEFWLRLQEACSGNDDETNCNKERGIDWENGSFSAMLLSTTRESMQEKKSSYHRKQKFWLHQFFQSSSKYAIFNFFTELQMRKYLRFLFTLQW